MVIGLGPTRLKKTKVMSVLGFFEEKGGSGDVISCVWSALGQQLG